MKTKACLIKAPDQPITNVEDHQGLGGNTELLSKSYSVQTLRTQIIDVPAPQKTLENAISQSMDEDVLRKGIDGRLFDVTPMPMSRKSAGIDKDGLANLLILQVTGTRQNELVAIVLTAPKYTRHRSEAAFKNYDYFFSHSPSQDPVTPSLLRENARIRDEEEAEERAQEEDLDMQDMDSLLVKQISLHVFPSKICSVNFGNPSTTFGRIHSGPWVCIRTVSSTLFSTVEVSSKKEQLLGFSPLRLVALLEILHGDSILSSGVISKRVMGNKHSNEKDKILKSRYPIVDVRFHPDRQASAITVDTRGNVGIFECDLLTVNDFSWERGVSWATKQMTEGEKLDLPWMLQWTEDYSIVVLASPMEILSLSLKGGKRESIYKCTNASVVDMVRSTSHIPLLWVATTKEVLLISLQSESCFQRLLTWQHHRSQPSHLQLTPISSTSTNTNAVVLSNRRDRYLSLFTATIDPLTNQATTQGEPRFLPTSLLSGTVNASGPVFADLIDLHALWYRWVTRSGKGKRRAVEEDHLMFELGQDGSIYVKTITWSTSLVSLQKEGPRYSHKFSENQRIEKPMSENTAERSMHSLSAAYRVLMMGTRELPDQSVMKRAVVALSQANVWLQEQDVPMEIMLLPHDLLALSNEEGFTPSGHSSALLRLPLLPMSIAAETGVQARLNEFLSSTRSDAWTIDLVEFIRNQLSSNVVSLSLSDSSSNSNSNINELSENLMKMYVPQDSMRSPGRPNMASIASRKLTEKMLDCCREIVWDMVLSSRVISMRPVLVEDVHAPSGQDQIEMEEGVEAGVERRRNPSEKPARLRQTPPFYLSFFTPRPEGTLQRGESNTSKNRKKIISKSARWLLSEWTIGSDPSEYVFQHPYETSIGGDFSESEGYASQSETEQRFDRRRSASTRSASLQQQHSEREASLQLASQQLPPTITSASQPMSMAIPSYLARSNLYHSQPIPAASSSSLQSQMFRTRPKKRRAGGF